VVVSSRNGSERLLFGEFLGSLGRLSWDPCVSKDPGWEFSSLVSAFGVSSRESCRWVSHWYRLVGHEFDYEPVVRAYVMRCLGHRLDRGLVFGFPRLLPVCALVFFGGRWRDCEGVVSGDHGACYLYARVLGGRLPVVMHNRMVMESYLGESYFIRRYLSDFC
jgi:hypothetical protein